MRPFTSGELARIKATHEDTFGKETAVGFTATVARIPANATSAAQRETVVEALACRRILPLDGRQTELAGFASNERIHRCKCEVNTAVQPNHRLILADGSDYHIRDVVPAPATEPRLLWLYLSEAS